MAYWTFLMRHPRLLLFGVLLTLFSSFGQTFLISIFVPQILADFSLHSGQFGTLYAAATLCSAASLPFFGKLLDRCDLGRYTLAVGLGLVFSCWLPISPRRESLVWSPGDPFWFTYPQGACLYRPIVPQIHALANEQPVYFSEFFPQLFELPHPADMKRCGWTAIKSAVIGTFTGATPGAGADIAEFLWLNSRPRKATPSAMAKSRVSLPPKPGKQQLPLECWR